MNIKNIRIAVISILLFVIVAGCHQYDDFTTYFNTYYNANRLIKESEEEFDYQDENRRITPRVVVPKPRIHAEQKTSAGPPEFLRESIVDMKSVQPVKIKLDSVIIKGSKILGKHPNSSYVEGTLYLMAKAYFYRREWLPAQIKCSELIDRYPSGDWSPDAHLMLSKTLLIQQKLEAGELMLSRTVDIAWFKKRYDILSEAFMLEAEMALYQNDIEGALRPYRQAIAQADDEEIKARWQVDLASLLYKMHQFERAEREFAKVHSYDPDYLSTFEAYLYQAQCLMRTGDFQKAHEILWDLENDGKFEEWLGDVYCANMTMKRLQKEEEDFRKMELFADSAYMNSQPLMAVYYEKGMEFFEENDYKEALKYFARTRNVRSPVFKISEKMYFLLSSWAQKRKESLPGLQKFNQGDQLSDSARAMISLALFEMGRVQEQLENKDSALFYYQSAIKVSPEEDPRTARYLYAYQYSIDDTDPVLADSLREVIVAKYPLTEYGQEAMSIQGYTEKFIIDTLQEFYKSGYRLRSNGDFRYAISQFLYLYDNYPETDYAPRSLYAIGWIYERDLRVVDTALYYYRLLIEKYPTSKYASDVRLAVDFLLALQSGAPLPDSLKTKEVNAYQPVKRDLTPIKIEDRKPVESSSPFDLFKDPSKMFDKAKEGLQESLDPNKIIDQAKEAVTNPGFSMPEGTMDLLNKIKDTTQTEMPPEPEKPKEKKEEGK